MKRLFTVALILLLGSPAIAGENPDINVFLRFDDGSNVANPAMFDQFDVYVCFENFGAGGGLKAGELKFNRTFSGIKVSQTVLLPSGIEIGDVEDDGWMFAGAQCEYPDIDGVVVAASVRYLYMGDPGYIEIVDHPDQGRSAVGCDETMDDWCVRSDPSGNAGVWAAPPVGECQSTIFVSLTGSDIAGDGSEGNPYATIQNGILMASDGDVVCAQPGTYTGPGNRDIDFMGKAITVRSCNGDPSTTIIDCQGSISEPHRGFIFQNDEGPESVLSGFTITGGYAENDEGGGVFLAGSYPPPSNGASPNIQWCDIVGNMGGGVTVIGASAHPTFSDCEISDNDGNGLIFEYARGDFFRCQINNNSSNGFSSFFYGHASFSDCEMNNNGNHGVYIPLTDGDLVLTRCLLDSNEGSGVFYSGDEGSGVIATDSDFTNNTGSGIEAVGIWNSLDISNCRINGNGVYGAKSDSPYFNNFFSDSDFIGNGSWGVLLTHNFKSNEAMMRDPMDVTTEIHNCRIGLNGEGGIGGEPEVSSSFGKVILVNNCLVFDNRGDGVYIELEASEAAYVELQVTGTTLVKNDGFGISSDAESLVLNKTLISNNMMAAVELGAISSLAISCNDFYANSGGDWTGPLASYLGVDGNISQSPLFCDFSGNDFSLLSSSVCLGLNQSGVPICGQIGSEAAGCTFDGTYYVSTVGSDATGAGSVVSPFSTIQHAIDYSRDGEVVCAQAGTYTGPGNRDIDFSGKAITVRSCDGDPATTIVDSQGSESEPHRGFIFENDEGPDSILDGFTITGGFIQGNGGGGILLTGEEDPPSPPTSASPTIQNCDIVNNTGGGVKARGFSIMTFSDCRFNDNSGTGFFGQYGGREFIRCQFNRNSEHGYDYVAYPGNVDFTDCEFLENGIHGIEYNCFESGPLNLLRCRLDGNGDSGLRFNGDEGSHVIARDTDFNNNIGTGFECFHGWWSSYEIYNCRINNNGNVGLRLSFDFQSSIQDSEIIGNGSWGVDVTHFDVKRNPKPKQNNNYRNFQIDNCLIGENGGGGIGGTLTINFGYKRCSISNSLIYDNRGDGIGILRGDVDPIMVDISNSTIALNDGRGIFAEADTLIVENTLVAFNDQVAADASQISTFEFSCSDFFGNSGGDWVGAIAPFYEVLGNISADPLFCGVADSENLYTLADESPCSAAANPACGQIGAFGVNCDVSSVEDTPSALPTVSRLYPAYPNPFNPRTTIKFDLNRSGPVDLAVFDVAGRLVSRLANQSMAAGSYEVEWEGMDDNGRQVGAGVYFLRLQLSDTVDTKRMTLVK